MLRSLALLLVLARPAGADRARGEITVSATVLPSCSVTVEPGVVVTCGVSSSDGVVTDEGDVWRDTAEIGPAAVARSRVDRYPGLVVVTILF